MKKFVSLLLAVIIALSASVVAFAEDPKENVYFCSACQAVFKDTKALDKHLLYECEETYDNCPYCEARITRGNMAEHISDCPKGAGSCKYCGESYDTQGHYAAHLETDCWLVGLVGIKVADFIIKVVDFLKGVDWEGLIGKVSDVVSGIDLGGVIDTIKPVFEKIIGFIGEKVELPAL